MENGTLANVPHLRELHLDNNALTSVPPGLSDHKYIQVHAGSMNVILQLQYMYISVLLIQVWIHSMIAGRLFLKAFSSSKLPLLDHYSSVSHFLTVWSHTAHFPWSKPYWKSLLCCIFAFGLFTFTLPDYKSTKASITEVTWFHLVCLSGKVLVARHTITLQTVAVGGECKQTWFPAL